MFLHAAIIGLTEFRMHIICTLINSEHMAHIILNIIWLYELNNNLLIGRLKKNKNNLLKHNYASYLST